MQTFEQYVLSEALDKALPWQWVYQDPDEHWTAEFKSRTNFTYKVTFGAMAHPGEWECVFYVKPSDLDYRGMNPSANMDVLGVGDQFAVFATVMAIIKDFFKNSPADAITFSAKEESRKRLYARFVQVANKLGFKGREIRSGAYIISR